MLNFINFPRFINFTGIYRFKNHFLRLALLIIKAKHHREIIDRSRSRSVNVTTLMTSLRSFSLPSYTNAHTHRVSALNVSVSSDINTSSLFLSPHIYYFRTQVAILKSKRSMRVISKKKRKEKNKRKQKKRKENKDVTHENRMNLKRSYFAAYLTALHNGRT